jgi:protein-S-isoprenylcysteine O-methyltransferase Ste14
MTHTSFRRSWILRKAILLPFGAALGCIQRIAREEELLRRELGEPYVEYASQRRRLVPGVY